MQILEDTDEFEVFNTEPILELIEFKWNNYSKSFHCIGCFMHFMYVGTIAVFTYFVYILNDREYQYQYVIVLAFGIFYPLCYDTI